MGVGVVQVGPLGVKGTNGTSIATAANPLDVQGTVTATPSGTQDVNIASDAAGLATEATLATLLTEATFTAEDFATQTTLEAARALLATIDADTSKLDVLLSTRATEATVATLLTEATFSAEDFATQTTLAAAKTVLDAISSQQTDGSHRTGVLGADGSTLASNANPHPVSDAGGSLTVDGVPEFDVVYPIDEDAHDLAAAAFTATSNISDDFILDYILLKFTTAESRDVTVTDADDAIVRELTGNTSLSYTLVVDKVFKGADNFTLAVTQTSGACSMDVKAVVKKGAISPALGGNASTSDVDIQNVAITGFDELRVVETTPVIALKSIYGVSALRDVVIETGGATVTSTDAEYRLQTTASGTDAATFSSAERGRYQAGSIAEAGIGVRRPTAPTGNQVAYWGYMDEDNGFFFGEDATGVFVARRRSGSLVAASKVYQSSWNVDKLDGTGTSGLTLNMAAGNIYRIVFTWYGYGVIEWQVILGSPQHAVTVHREMVTGETSVPNPNLPVRAEVDNDGTATAFDLFVAGRQFSIIGKFDPNRRISAAVVEGKAVSTTLIPVMTFRRKSEFPSGVNNGASVKFQQLEIITDNDVLWEVRQGSTLTGASYVTPSRVSASETALEVDTSATAGSGGEFLNTGIAHGGARNSNEFTEASFRFDLIETEPATLYMRRIGNQDAVVHVVMKMREEW